MKQQQVEKCSRHQTVKAVLGLRSALLAGVAAALLTAPPGCDFGGPSDPGVGLSGVTQSAPRLEEFDPTGRYTPYYSTADMGRPRYFHEWAVTQGGAAVIFGGSDERGFSAIDNAEFFDQSTFEKDAPRPESLAGVWIDTNLDGDPIAFENGPRILFTVSSLSGHFIIVGGSSDLLGGPLVEKVEIFDPDTRTFESIEADMIQPRFRHSAIQQNDGSVLITGGQIMTTVTEVNDQAGGFGVPGQQTQVTVFVSTPESEFYDATDGVFKVLTIPGTENPSKLNTPRGRAGHAMARIAGPDNTLESSDDIFFVAGGFQTLSAQFAPRDKQPGAVGRVQADGLTVLEFYDPLTQIFTQVGNVQMPSPRINRPYIMNLGQFNDLTIDGVKGMGNVVLLTHGNTDGTCPITPIVDDLLVANFTGFGPAQGLQFFAVEDNQFGSHVQGIEYGLDFVAGRCSTNPLPMPRAMVTAPGVPSIETWIIALGGVDILCCPCAYLYGSGSDTIAAGCVFDPFFSLLSVQLGLSARDLTTSRTSTNPTGVVGTWLTMDGFIPTTNLELYGNTQPSRWGKPAGLQRVWYPNIPLPGEDGIPNTPDDRILLAGGGQDYPSSGGEPTTPSTEIFLPPRVNSTVPWE